MNRIAIFGKKYRADLIPDIKEIFLFLTNSVESLHVHGDYLDMLNHSGIDTSQCDAFDELSESMNIDLMISIGGDGTLLESSTLVKDLEIPIVGINAGRLGFLATIQIENAITALKQVLQGEYTLDRRNLIELLSSKPIFGGFPFGLNEFAISKKDTSSMIIIHTYIDDVFLNSYWADGLIISTPTGSTGYSLSCGGPLVLPQTNNFVISPINPHNLNMRPMVVPDSSVIGFEVESRNKSHLVSLDSRSESVSKKMGLKVKKADFTINLVSVNTYNHFETLRKKLNWGLDFRN